MKMVRTPLTFTFIFLLFSALYSLSVLAQTSEETSPEPSPSASPSATATPVPTPPRVPPSNLPTIKAVPPAPSRLFLSLPLSEDDPLRVVMIDGPFERAQEDIAELMTKDAAEKDATIKGCNAILRSGMEAMRDRNYDAAENFFLKAIQASCTNGLAHFYLGTLYEFRGRYREAIQLLPIAKGYLEKQVPPSRYVVHCDATLGRTYFRLENFQAASFHLNQVLMKFPDDLPHLYYSGASLLRLGAFDRGLGQLEKVLTLARVVRFSRGIAVQAALLLGEVNARLGQYPVALQHVKTGLTFDPQNARLLALQRRILEAAKKRERRGVQGLFGL